MVLGILVIVLLVLVAVVSAVGVFVIALVLVLLHVIVVILFMILGITFGVILILTRDVVIVVVLMIHEILVVIIFVFIAIVAVGGEVVIILVVVLLYVIVVIAFMILNIIQLVVFIFSLGVVSAVVCHGWLLRCWVKSSRLRARRDGAAGGTPARSAAGPSKSNGKSPRRAVKQTIVRGCRCRYGPSDREAVRNGPDFTESVFRQKSGSPPQGIRPFQLIRSTISGLPPGSGGFANEPKHSRRMVWQRGELGAGFRQSSRRKRSSACWTGAACQRWQQNSG